MDISKEPKKTLDAVRREARRGQLRQQLPARPPAGRAGRAVRAALRLGLGLPRHRPGEDIRDGLTKKCTTMDKPVAALIKDLKSRGLLDDTLVIWGGEFGRTPFREGRTAGGQRPRPRPLPRLLLARARPAAASRPGYTHGESRRARLLRRRRTRSTSTTCRRRSCTCSASTTRS